MLPCTAALFGRGPGGRERGGKRGRENKSIVPLAVELKNRLQLGCFPKVLCHRLAQPLNVSSNSRSAKGIKTISKSQKQTNKNKTTMNSGLSPDLAWTGSGPQESLSPAHSSRAARLQPRWPWQGWRPPRIAQGTRTRLCGCWQLLQSVSETKFSEKRGLRASREKVITTHLRFSFPRGAFWKH